MNTSTIFNQLPVALKEVVADFVTAQPASHHKALMDELCVMRKQTLLTEFGDDIRSNDWGEGEYDFDDIDDLEEINDYYVKRFGLDAIGGSMGWYFNIRASTILEIKRDGFEMPENTDSDDDY